MASFLNEVFGFSSVGERRSYFKAKESKYRHLASGAESPEDKRMYVHAAIEAESQAEDF